MARFLSISSSIAGVKKAMLAAILAISWLSLGAPPFSIAALAATQLAAGDCPASGISASSGAINLTSNCKVGGNITLSGTASLTMTGAVLTVDGNIVLNDQAQLAITNGGLTIAQTYYNQYYIALNNSSKLNLNNSTLVTTGILKTYFSMTMEARNSSVVNVKSSTLSWQEGSWLLGNFRDQSQLFVDSSSRVPTEIYPFDSAQISVTNSSFPTLFVAFKSGSSATINIPKSDAKGKYNFVFGKSPGFDYSINMTASWTRLGFESHPGSRMILNGGGAGSTTDAPVQISYFVENNTAPVTIKGLDVLRDTTRKFTDQGRTISLNHVNLNPISWQVYVSQSNGFPVTIRNSKINELGVLTNGLVNLSNSTLQLAQLGAFGSGSRLNITGTQIWSQGIVAQRGGRVSIKYSGIHGNAISAAGTGSSISMSNATEFRNGSASMSCAQNPATGYAPNVNGVPLCNPQNPLGRCSQVSTRNGGVVTGIPACM
ncbi:MAG: hypothetical protein ACT4O2_03030 [Beijerinckiaceae bacterium]